MTTTTTTIGIVLDGLVAAARNSADTGTIVFDGEGDYQPQQNTLTIIIGADSGETEDGVISDETFGDLAMWETYQVVCRVEYNTGAVSQKTARDAAITGYARFLAAVQADPSLAGSIDGYVRPATFSLQQTSVDDLQAGARGRYARINVTFDVKTKLELS